MKNSWFIWIPKTAGTSIHNTLLHHGLKVYRSIKEFTQFDQKGLATFSHADPQYLINKKVINKAFLNSSFKFAVVRNPWDRLVSLYWHMHRDGSITFQEFINDLTTNSIHPIGPYKQRINSIANSQLSWILSKDGTPHTDYIARFETIEKDFKHIISTLDLPPTPLRHANRSKRSIADKLGIANRILSPFLPHISSKTAKHLKRNPTQYRKYYNRGTKSLVKSLYQDTIDYFNYSF